MKALVFICLLWVFHYNCSEIARNWKGSSSTLETVVSLEGLIGKLLFLITFIWSFWHYEWWQPIVAFIVTMFAAGIIANLFQKTLIGMMVSMVAVPVFSTLAIISLCQM